MYQTRIKRRNRIYSRTAYIATGLTHGEQMPDREEFIKLEKYSLEDAMQMIEDGKIIDSKTLIAIYAYANHVLKKQIRQGI